MKEIRFILGSEHCSLDLNSNNKSYFCAENTTPAHMKAVELGTNGEVACRKAVTWGTTQGGGFLVHKKYTEPGQNKNMVGWKKTRAPFHGKEASPSELWEPGLWEQVADQIQKAHTIHTTPLKSWTIARHYLTISSKSPRH